MRDAGAAPRSRSRAWWLAIRPRTLSISMVPVGVGSALAWADQRALYWIAMGVALACAMLIQAGTNLYNDAGDFERGADGPDRLGPARASASGWLAAAEVRRAALGCFGLALLLGLYLVWHAGWVILALGLASICAGIAYTAGPRPIAYGPFGELFVWLFFGLAAVMGSYYLHAFSFASRALLAASLVGMLAAAVIVVNNYRDLDSDRRVGKRTLAVRIGRRATRFEYLLLTLVPFALSPLLFISSHRPWIAALPLLALPLALRLLNDFRRQPPGPGLNRILARTAQLQVVFGVLLAAALVIAA